MAEGDGNVHFILQEPERVPLQFHFDPTAVSVEEAEVMGHIKQLVEKMLYHWKAFPIVLPPSLTNQGEDKGMINYRDLFVAPSFDELEQVATDPFGELKKLNNVQLDSIWDTGDFEVPSINFPGQSHKWKLSQLLQKGSLNARDTLLNDTALSLQLLIITARNRFISPFFSLSESVKSWGRGLWKILDIVFGMPSTSTGELESKIHTEHMRYLVAELDVKPSYRKGFGKFCSFVKEISRLSTAEKRKKPTLRPPPIPYIYQTPKGLDIDLRLFNKDLINNCLPILSNILEREAKGWYVNFRQKLIASLKGQGLTNEEVSKSVNDAVKDEYLRRVYSAILNNAELESLETGIGALLVSQAKSVIVMHDATKHQQQKLQKHKAALLAHLKKAYPVKSRISPWVQEQMVAFEREFVLQNLWSAHEEAISLCEEEALYQAVYFLRRDLAFIKEREEILLKELGRIRIPNRLFTFSMRIWFPSNWVTVKTLDGVETVVPTVIAEKGKRPPAVTNDHSNGFYGLTKHKRRKTTTRYPLWRWYNYLQRTWSWMWNSIFIFGGGKQCRKCSDCSSRVKVVVPWCSPLSLRALLFIKPFQPDLKISQQDGQLYPSEASTTQTLISRLAAIWSSVRKSREQFESTPDRGLIGKSMTRHLNRFWNYVLKGFFGSVLLVVVFPVMSVTVSALSLVLAVTAPVWTPVVTLLSHMFAVIVWDFDCPDSEMNRFFIVFEAIIWRWLVQGTIQPIAATVFGFMLCPLAALGISVFGVTRRGGRAFWDTFMYNVVIKRRARVPASDGFVARRIAGPGLASNYFLQIRPEQAIAALEANMESEELDAFKVNALKVIEKPVVDFRKLVSQVFKPFSAVLTEEGVFKQLQTETSNYRTDLSNKINQRQWRLNTGMSLNVQNKIKLPEKELKTTIVHAAGMLEAFYPSHVINLLSVSEEDYWEKRSLEFRDWTGLASQKLSHIFSKSFLVPMEEADNNFQLKVEHLNLGRYIKMIESASVRDDLDVVTEVHTDTGDVTTNAPHFDVSYFDPTHGIVKTRYYATRRQRFPWRRGAASQEYFDKLEVPLPIPHPAVIAISIYNRENERLALSYDDTMCNSLIKAIISFKDFADTNTTDSIDLEMSTPENGIEPVSVISHLAEQEKSFSDDNSAGARSPVGTSIIAVGATPATPNFERKIQTFADEENEDMMAYIDSKLNLEYGEGRNVNQQYERASVNTENEIEDDIYTEEGSEHPMIPAASGTPPGETSF